MSSPRPLPPELAQLTPALAKQAFAHRSLRAQSVAHYDTNERLEFLGDAVLELVVSDFLYATFPQYDEGTLTRYRAAIVRTESLAAATDRLGLQDHLHMNTGIDDMASEISESVMADLFEAVIGALYLDAGYASTRSFIEQHLLTTIDETALQNSAKDPKTRLQEYVQAAGQETPVYAVVREVGPDHAKEFTSAVTVGLGEPGQIKTFTGTGPSKQKAEQAAAQVALAALNV